MNSIYAQGLDRQGFPDLARDVKYTHVDALRVAGGLYEFLYVDRQDRVRYLLADRAPEPPEEDVIYGTNRPEPNQGWTVSFALRVLLELEEPIALAAVPITWQPRLVQEIGERTELTTRLLTEEEVLRARQGNARVSYSDKVEARRREDEIVSRGCVAAP